MPNEEIISALRNAIDHGESLQSAVQIMINSGYNSEEVLEASKFIGGTLSMQEIMPEEQLTMPEERRNFSSNFNFLTKNKIQSQPTQIIPQSQIQKQPLQPPRQYFQQIQQPKQQMQQLPQYSQEVTQSQIKQSFQQPFQQYPLPIQKQPLQPPQQPQKQIQQTTQQSPQQQFLRQAPRPSPQLITRQGDLSREIKKIKPPRKSYLKEIILLVILMLLIGALIATILYKDVILKWFS